MSRPTTPHEKARSAGYIAALNGKNVSENPFHSIVMRERWEAGYREYAERPKKRKEQL